MDHFVLDFNLPKLDFDCVLQPSPSDTSTTVTTPSSNANTNESNSQTDKAARKRELNRLAQYRCRERKRRRLEQGGVSPLRGNNKTTSSIGSHHMDAQDLIGRDTTPLQQYHHTDTDLYQVFPDEHSIVLGLTNLKRALFQISISISNAVPSFKYRPNDTTLSSSLNYITLSNMTKQDDPPIADSSPESESTSLSLDSKVSQWNKALDLLPENLRPTQLQLATPHHPAFDTLPWPSFRDKLLLLGSRLHEECSCGELMEGLIVWGNRPELEDNWEITPRFAELAWFLLDKHIVKRTNWWRSQRNLPPIDLDAISEAQELARMKQKKRPIYL